MKAVRSRKGWEVVPIVLIEPIDYTPGWLLGDAESRLALRAALNASYLSLVAAGVVGTLTTTSVLQPHLIIRFLIPNSTLTLKLGTLTPMLACINLRAHLCSGHCTPSWRPEYRRGTDL